MPCSYHLPPTRNVNTRTKAPAAFFSKEVTLSLEASMEDSVAQTQRKRVCATLRSPRPALGSCVQLLWHRQNGHTTFFRPLLFPLCYWQLNASPDGSTGKLQVDRVLENGSRLGRSGWTLGSRTGPRKVRCPCVSLLDAILLLLTLPFHPGQDDDFFFFFFFGN